MRFWPVAAGLAFVVGYGLGPALLAGLFAYTILDVTHRQLRARTGPRRARWLAVAIFIVVSVTLTVFVGRFLTQSAATVPVILSSVLPAVSDVAAKYGMELPFDSLADIRLALVNALRDNVRNIGRASGVLTKGFFHLAVAISIAVLCFLSEAREPPAGTLWSALRERGLDLARRFMRSFELVAGAQVAISAINTFFTAIFLLTMGFPHIGFLIPATFFLGMLPLVGNLLSNTIIVCAGLTISPKMGVFALAFLVTIHKAEYFLNSRIVGSSVGAPMWQTLLGILVGELVMGVAGIILAPAVLHFVREELSATEA
ncbi:MAG: AI-2E family transporter [Elusimicrobia bacterium]|nr:AI-2E family transporter [Elusimicrobiota bacterium]